ncbi:Aryl-alcohol dehydrogenase [Lachnellula subtilissima]|uniref:Aryl-alcohol dehydrogenase n=1 Tax=Lachnellula subtilissima TaxID=602034 RepID=A0A8H8RXA8_9HELO|nr:Aryl-alcohol dehydrogenase [Lachnellula subtilissima]
MDGANPTPVSMRAIVANKPTAMGKPNWNLEHVNLRELDSNELLIRMVATGVCHTDMIFASMPSEAGAYPKVLGHEGAGYVHKIGSEVQNAIVGDSVLLSFQSCSICKNCKANHPSYCQQFQAMNLGGEQGVFEMTSGSKASGAFFGQSSFSSYAIVKESSTVKVTELVNNEEELKLFAPMGCGFQTGIGTVENLTAAGSQDTIVIIGLGGVGLTAIMAAKMKGCAMIIGVDRVLARLEMATSFGATHVLNTSDNKLDLTQEIKTLTGGNGSTITIDTTGNLGLIASGMDFTGLRGQMVLLGVPPMDASLAVNLFSFMQTGKRLLGSIEGDVTPSEWYREGKLPIDKILKFYPVEEFQLAMSEMDAGVTIKPIITW